MRSKHGKIILTLFVFAAAVRLLRVFLPALQGQDTWLHVLDTFTSTAIVAILCLLPIFILFDRFRGRYKRAAHDMSSHAEAYLCTMEMGSSYRVISADSEGITIWKIKRRIPVPVDHWPWREADVTKDSIQLTSVRSGDGLHISGPAASARLAIYTPASNLLSSPISGAALDEIIARWQTAAPKIGQ